MRIAIVSDAWLPQINGVVRTLDTVRAKLAAVGHDSWWSAPTLQDPAVSHLSGDPPGPAAGARGQTPARRVRARLDPHRDRRPLGMAARRYCLTRDLAFTTSFHTKFAEYLHARTRFPVSWSYAWLRRFHAASKRIMVATPSSRPSCSSTASTIWRAGRAASTPPCSGRARRHCPTSRA